MKNVVSIKGRHESGVETRPHLYKRGVGKGMYSVSRTRYAEDYIYCDSLDELAAYLSLGYKVRMSNPEQGITAPSAIVRSSLTIEVENGAKNPTIESLLPAIIEESGSLDSLLLSKRRKEQHAIRAFLVGESDTSLCALCQSRFPISLLVAAHIKKRSKCSVAEKLDFENIATLMCKFGCDPLYENGYISVEAGVVVDLQRIDVTSHVQGYIDKIKGNKVPNWAGSKVYYEWHLNKMRNKE